MAFSLILVLSIGDWYLLAVLLRYRVAHVPRYLPLNLFLYSLTLFLRFVLCDLLVVVGALIFVFCVTMLLSNMIALLSGNILAVLLGHIFTVLLGHLVAHLLGLAVTLGGWDYRSYSLMHVLAL